jgi:hypothetical protein
LQITVREFMINKTFYISNESLYYGNLEKCQKINVRQTVLFLCTKWRVKCFYKKNTPFLTRFLDSMQCFQFNKKLNAFLGTSNFCLQLRLNVSEFLIMLISTMFHQEKWLNVTWYQKFRTDNSALIRCESGRLPPPDADRKRMTLAFHNSPTLSVRRYHLCPQFTNRQVWRNSQKLRFWIGLPITI